MTRPNTTNRRRGKRSWKETNFLVKSQRLPTRRLRGRERGYLVRGIERTAKRAGRAMARRALQNHVAIDLRPRPPKKPQPARKAAKVSLSKNATKRELLISAWEVGFRGKSYRKAKRFERRLERDRR
jgi:hypothetical protein